MSNFLDLVTFTEEILDENCHCLWSIVLFTNRPICFSKPKSFDHKHWIKIGFYKFECVKLKIYLH